jgi:hypothetical protein
MDFVVIVGFVFCGCLLAGAFCSYFFGDCFWQFLGLWIWAAEIVEESQTAPNLVRRRRKVTGR